VQERLRGGTPHPLADGAKPGILLHNGAGAWRIGVGWGNETGAMGDGSGCGRGCGDRGGLHRRTRADVERQPSGHRQPVRHPEPVRG
jgi:hypothetical protein